MKKFFVIAIIAIAPFFANAQVATGVIPCAGSGLIDSTFGMKIRYEAGTFSDVAYFGTIKLQSLGSTDVYIAAYNCADNSVLWAYSLGTPNEDHAMRLYFDCGHQPTVSATYVAGPADLVHYFDKNGDNTTEAGPPQSTVGVVRWYASYVPESKTDLFPAASITVVKCM